MAGWEFFPLKIQIIFKFNLPLSNLQYSVVKSSIFRYQIFIIKVSVQYLFFFAGINYQNQTGVLIKSCSKIFVHIFNFKVRRFSNSVGAVSGRTAHSTCFTTKITTSVLRLPDCMVYPNKSVNISSNLHVHDERRTSM